MSRKLTSRSTRYLAPNGSDDTAQAGLGVEVDPDSVGGSEGRDLDEAFDLYERFTDKKVRQVIKLNVTLPKELICVGDAVSVMYRSDKWYDDGKFVDYKHVHDAVENREYAPGKGPRFYEPARTATPVIKKLAANKAGGVLREDLVIHRCSPPVGYPKAVAVLAKCLGWFVRRYDDGREYELTPRNTYLLGSPKANGNLLIVYCRDPRPNGQILGLISGGKLRILKDGIDG